MKRLYRLPVLALLALSFVAVGCDSGEEAATDAELFVGTFTVTKIENNLSSTGTGGSDVTGGVICPTPNPSTNPPTCTVNSIKLTFNANNSYTIAVDYTNLINAAPASAGGRQDVNITGTSYTVNESAKTLTLVIPGTTPITAQATYTINESGQATLLVPAVVFNNIFGTTSYTGYVRISGQKS
ncbi:MAG TPA: hypothetical protein VD948_05795 [Rhodothermales bacterium]|nr:hypothetical protein [Rhodothermales bacterium]